MPCCSKLSKAHRLSVDLPDHHPERRGAALFAAPVALLSAAAARRARLGLRHWGSAVPKTPGYRSPGPQHDQQATMTDTGIVTSTYRYKGPATEAEGGAIRVPAT